MARPLGLVATPHASPSATAIGRVKAAAASLPASVDLTPNAMPVGDQGQVGSCAAWATDYSALGYWVNAEKLRGGGLEPMYTYAQYVNAYDGGQDRGSSIDYHLQVAEQQGVDNQSDYSQGNFDYSDVPTSAEHLNAVNWKLSGHTDLPIQPSASSTLNQQSIEGCLAAGNPVVIGIPVYWSFELIGSANNGYYSGPTSNDPFMGNHAIVALGYNSQGLVIENSWGTSWGHAGYATLSWSFINQYVFQATSVGKLVTGQPANTVAPTVGGNVAQGTALTATAGNWSRPRRRTPTSGNVPLPAAMPGQSSGRNERRLHAAVRGHRRQPPHARHGDQQHRPGRSALGERRPGPDPRSQEHRGPGDHGYAGPGSGADRVYGNLESGRHGARLPVAALHERRQHLVGDHRRDDGDLHAGDRGSWREPPRGHHREQQLRSRGGHIGHRRSGRLRRARQQGRAVSHRHAD